MKPMLAMKTRPDKVEWPLYVQPKLNGVRALFIGEDSLQSRDEHIWEPEVVRHLLVHLNNVAGEFILDGELYFHGMSLQQINSRIAVNRAAPHAESGLIEYHVFDVAAHVAFADRVELLEELRIRFEGTVVKLVETYLCTTEHQADRAFELCKKQGYEGIMYRLPNAPYGFAENCGNKQNRWWCLQKRKDWLDVDCEIVSFEEGKGRLQGMLGAFTLVTPQGVAFSAGGGLTDEQRRSYWAAKETMLGGLVKVKYEMLSDGGVPLKPTIIQVNE